MTNEANLPRVLVIGGGPASLSFSSTLVHYHKVDLHVYESRWYKTQHDGIQWKGNAQQNYRRDQVVTIQSAVFKLFPPHIEATIFPPDGYSEMWPHGSESPREKGFPRNVSIRDVEDRLLELVKQSPNITLHPNKLQPEELDPREWQLVVIADGARSSFRQHYEYLFGKNDPTAYSLSPNNHVTDTVLAVKVITELSNADSVILTVCQNRFLLNARNENGYIYIRLTKEEAQEVEGQSLHDGTIASCIQSRPCVMQLTRQGFMCPTHKALFKPAINPQSKLWPRVLDALKLFKAEPFAITSFNLSMTSRSRFVIDITPNDILESGTNAKRQEGQLTHQTFACLLGDAANSIHFWPGRGMNSAFCSSIALARTLTMRWRLQPFLRSAHFINFEATMAALQHRHKDRAWRNMVTVKDGKKQSIADVICESLDLDDESGTSGEKLTKAMGVRLTKMVERLNPRLPQPADPSTLLTQLRTVCVETMSVMVNGGMWETRFSAGTEVDIDHLVPDPGEIREEHLEETEKQERFSTDTQSSNRDIDILGETSIRASYNHAISLKGEATLNWQAACREMRGLLVRADKGHNVSNEQLIEAIAEADELTPDRIEEEEFVSAMKFIIQNTLLEHLDEEWAQWFENAADRNSVLSLQAAKFIIEKAEGKGKRTEWHDRNVLEAELRKRSGSNRITRDIYFKVAREMLYG